VWLACGIDGLSLQAGRQALQGGRQAAPGPFCFFGNFFGRVRDVADSWGDSWMGMGMGMGICGWGVCGCLVLFCFCSNFSAG